MCFLKLHEIADIDGFDLKTEYALNLAIMYDLYDLNLLKIL
jgi:hypothetical protein